jgi:hypothetical protein
MRKIQSKEDKAKKQKRQQMWLGIILVVVMFGSVFGVIVNSFNASSQKGEKMTYKGHKLIKQGTTYLLSIGEKTFYFSENPNNVTGYFENMNISKIITTYLGNPLYIDSENYQVTQEIYQNINGYPQRIQMACYNQEDCVDESLPIKDCSNNLIIIRESEENKIYEEDSCIFIEGKQEDLLKLADAFLLKILGLN